MSHFGRAPIQNLSLQVPNFNVYTVLTSAPFQCALGHGAATHHDRAGRDHQPVRCRQQQLRSSNACKLVACTAQVPLRLRWQSCTHAQRGCARAGSGIASSPLKATGCGGEYRTRQGSLSSTTSPSLLRAHTLHKHKKTPLLKTASRCAPRAWPRARRGCAPGPGRA